MDGAGSVLKIGPEGLANGLQVGGVGRRVKDDSEVFGRALGQMVVPFTEMGDWGRRDSWGRRMRMGQ